MSAANTDATGRVVQPPVFETLDLVLDGQVATVILARPERANAIDAVMWVELQACFEWLDETPEVRAVVLAGKGRHFCSGIDLAMFETLRPTGERGRSAEHLRRRILELQGNLTTIERCRVPVIAAVQGACVGGGLDLVACCDIRIAADDTFFSIKEIEVGLVADVGSLQRLPHLLGDGMVRELAYTGRRMAADEALALRLVNAVHVGREATLGAAQGMARDIASRSPLAIRGIKATLLHGRDHTVEASLDYAATWNAGMLSFDDVQAAVNSARGEPPVYDD